MSTTRVGRCCLREAAAASAAGEATTPGAAASGDRPPRRIRSYVLRGGRLSPKQRRGLELLLPRYGVAFAPQRPDWDALFGRCAPRVLEVGFGMGQTTAQMAAAMPDRDFIAVEVHAPGVGNLCNLLAEGGLTNVRIVQHDAVEVLEWMIAPASLAAVHIYFPDPWPKKRHHKRRLIQPPFVALVASRLAPDGYLHLATDWEPYAEQMLAVLSAEPLLANTVSGYAPRPSWRPQTKFEQRGRALGHGTWDLIFRRRA
ncbi:MAG: tRNA (guanosine(46)-N7)-methyltransferase TrmB [Casimicrobiaceae bacterium]|nr:tRNA (guanosine(46)-N7)-methyltransferase TrmB [Casimicrobiaceae bacterium]